MRAALVPTRAPVPQGPLPSRAQARETAPVQPCAASAARAAEEATAVAARSARAHVREARSSVVPIPNAHWATGAPRSGAGGKAQEAASVFARLGMVVAASEDSTCSTREARSTPEAAFESEISSPVSGPASIRDERGAGSTGSAPGSQKSALVRPTSDPVERGPLSPTLHAPERASPPETTSGAPR